MVLCYPRHVYVVVKCVGRVGTLPRIQLPRHLTDPHILTGSKMFKWYVI